jgi:hypothetical protein
MRIFARFQYELAEQGRYNGLNMGLCLIYDMGTDHPFWSLEKQTAMVREMAQFNGAWLWS